MQKVGVVNLHESSRDNKKACEGITQGNEMSMSWKLKDV